MIFRSDCTVALRYQLHQGGAATLRYRPDVTILAASRSDDSRARVLMPHGYAFVRCGGRTPRTLPAADYAREERWAQEIVPSIVVGDAVYLATPARAEGARHPDHAVRAPRRAGSSSSTAWACIRTGD